jgi:hypothetical protein
MLLSASTKLDYSISARNIPKIENSTLFDTSQRNDNGRRNPGGLDATLARRDSGAGKGQPGPEENRHCRPAGLTASRTTDRIHIKVVEFRRGLFFCGSLSAPALPTSAPAPFLARMCLK